MNWLNINYGPHDWPEDASHENGAYNNTCINCNHIFVGHKRRVCCKVCHRDAPALSPEEFSVAWKKAMEMDCGDPPIDLAQKREKSFLENSVVLVGAGVGARNFGPGIVTFFKNGEVVEGPYRVESFEVSTSGSSKYDGLEERVSGLGDFTMTFGQPLVSEVHDLKALDIKPVRKEKAQWKRERSGRR